MITSRRPVGAIRKALGRERDPIQFWLFYFKPYIYLFFVYFFAHTYKSDHLFAIFIMINRDDTFKDCCIYDGKKCENKITVFIWESKGKIQKFLFCFAAFRNMNIIDCDNHMLVFDPGQWLRVSFLNEMLLAFLYFPHCL